MRLRGRAGVWLALAPCAVAAISASLALGLQERGLRRDLAQVTREHLDRSRAVSARLLHLHLVGALRRHRASAQTPEVRANLELGHAPTLEYFAEQLAAQQGAKALAFLNAGVSVAGAGDDALAKAALARRAELGVDPEACAPAEAWVCADAASDGTAFPLAHRGRLHAVALVTMRVGPRSLGQLLAVEEIGPAALAEWAELVQAHIAIQSAKPGPLSALVGDLGSAQLRVEVSGDAERLALLNARRDLHAGARRHRSRIAHVRDHRERAALRPAGCCARRARARGRAGRAHRPRRLRHRLLVALLPA
jgi:hypothetical protein